MSTSKLDTSGVFDPLRVKAGTTQISLPHHAVNIRKNGIEFRSVKPIPIWTEMSVEMRCPRNDRKVNCTGVVVECNGNRHSGYLVSMLFTDLSPQSQEQLSSLTYSEIA